MASSSKSTIRSISLPSRSHPATERLEEELNKLKSWGGSCSATPTLKTIADGLSRLVDLYKSMDDLLNLGLTQKAIYCRQHERFVDDLQDGFMSLLDTCGTARDVVLLIKEHSRDIQSCLRRRKGESDVERRIAVYVSFRKKTSKESKKMTKTDKQKLGSSGSPFLEIDDRLVSGVVRTLGEVVLESFSILHSLVVFICVPMLKPKHTRRSLVAKLMQSETCEDVNELQHLDVALQVLLCRSEPSEGDRIKDAQNRLKSLEVNIESIENGLECLFRGLIKARASLLNIVSA